MPYTLNKISIICSVFILFFSTSTLAKGAKPTPKDGTSIQWVQGLQAKKQETPNWCWAAATQMLLSRFQSQPPEQCAIVGRALKIDCCNLPRHRRGICENYGGERMLEALRSYRRSTIQKDGSNFDAVMADIKKGFPVIIVGNIGGTQHAFVGYGTYIAKDSTPRVILWEPINNKNVIFSKRSAMWDYTIHSR